MYVFVAATASSGPVPRSTACSAATARSDAGSFDSATVGAPWRRAAATTSTMSGDRPDCEIPMTSDRSNRGSTP